MKEEASDLRALQVTLLVKVGLFVIKLAGYLVTGVLALLAQAMDSLSDILISLLLVAGLLYSRKGPDSEHMLGHGRAQNVAALVAATVFLSFTSLELYREAVPKLLFGFAPEYSDLGLAAGVIIVSMVVGAAPLLVLLRQRTPGAAAKAQTTDLVTDQIGLTAALLGIFFISKGWHQADPLVAILVATIIAYKAAGLFRENLSFLIGKSPDAEHLAQIRDIALSVTGVLEVHDIRAEYIGPGMVHAGIHIVVRRGLVIEEADRIAEEVRDRIQNATGCSGCVVHTDPAPEARWRRTEPAAE